jgi:Tfp pilus assembly protein PilZ
MSNDQKRRENERYENLAREDPIVMARFKVRSDVAQEMWSDDWDSVFLMNISAGGIFFYYTKDLGIGTLLDLKIYMPNAVLVINCVGKVIRIDKPRHHTSMFGIAIKFTEIGELEKEIINTTLQEFLEYKIKNF